MDRYFTSIPLLDAPIEKMYVCGTIMKSRLPKQSKLKGDGEMKKLGRGSIDQTVRSDASVVLVKWFDIRPVVAASTILQKDPVTSCTRWCRKTKQYIEVERPDIITKYNAYMGGVDNLDRCISMYRSKAKTKNWTV